MQGVLCQFLEVWTVLRSLIPKQIKKSLLQKLIHSPDLQNSSIRHPLNLDPRADLRITSNARWAVVRSRVHHFDILPVNLPNLVLNRTLFMQPQSLLLQLNLPMICGQPASLSVEWKTCGIQASRKAPSINYGIQALQHRDPVPMEVYGIHPSTPLYGAAQKKSCATHPSILQSPSYPLHAPRHSQTICRAVRRLRRQNQV